MKAIKIRMGTLVTYSFKMTGIYSCIPLIKWRQLYCLLIFLIVTMSVWLCGNFWIAWLLWRCVWVRTLNLLNSLTSQSLIPIITKMSRITNQTATLIDNIFINQPNGFLSLIIWPSFIIYSKTKPVYKKILNKTNVKYRLIKDSTITNLWQSLLCLDLNHITGFDNCTTAMESLVHAVDNTYKLWVKTRRRT